MLILNTKFKNELCKQKTEKDVVQVLARFINECNKKKYGPKQVKDLFVMASDYVENLEENTKKAEQRQRDNLIEKQYIDELEKQESVEKVIFAALDFYINPQNQWNKENISAFFVDLIRELCARMNYSIEDFFLY